MWTRAAVGRRRRLRLDVLEQQRDAREAVLLGSEEERADAADHARAGVGLCGEEELGAAHAALVARDEQRRRCLGRRLVDGGARAEEHADALVVAEVGGHVERGGVQLVLLGVDVGARGE